MTILGIDPGTASTGYGLIKVLNRKSGLLLEYQSHGVIKTFPKMPMSKRLLLLKTQLSAILAKTRPDVVVIEQLFFGRNSQTAMTVGQARGIVLLATAEIDTALFEYQGLFVKRIVSGDGRADKKKIQKTVKKILKLKDIPKPDDAADALAIAICHAKIKFTHVH